ncbi:hypothetical protein V6Z11_D13G073000 [Gossypium hirsutum]
MEMRVLWIPHLSFSSSFLPRFLVWSRRMTYVKRQFTSFAHKGRVEDIFLRYFDHNDEHKEPLENEAAVYLSVSLFSPFPQFSRLFLSSYFAFYYLCLRFLYERLKRLKYEAEILDKLGSIEALERKLTDLNWKKYEAEDKMRSYNPDMTKILTISEAVLHQQFVMDAILRIEKLKNKKLLEQEVSSAKPNDVEVRQLKELQAQEHRGLS